MTRKGEREAVRSWAGMTGQDAGARGCQSCGGIVPGFMLVAADHCSSLQTTLLPLCVCGLVVAWWGILWFVFIGRLPMGLSICLALVKKSCQNTVCTYSKYTYMYRCIYSITHSVHYTAQINELS
jgi:hypothetical protein